MARILVVETNDAVRSLLVRALRRVSHDVVADVTVSHAGDMHAGAEFDLVIVNASGGNQQARRWLAREVRMLWRARVLIISGGGGNDQTVAVHDSFVFVAKPFKLTDLLAGVDAALRLPVPDEES